MGRIQGIRLQPTMETQATAGGDDWPKFLRWFAPSRLDSGPQFLENVSFLVRVNYHYICPYISALQLHNPCPSLGLPAASAMAGGDGDTGSGAFTIPPGGPHAGQENNRILERL